MTSPVSPELARLFEKDKKFLQWQNKLQAHDIALLDYKILSVISRDGQHIFAALVDCQVQTPDGKSFPRIMFFKVNMMRGAC